MAHVHKQLAQLQPTVTTPVTLYSVPANTEATVCAIYLNNGTGSAVTVDIYNDDDGSTYDATTEIYTVSVGANSTHVIESKIMLGTASGTVGIAVSTATSVNATVYGMEVS